MPGKTDDVIIAWPCGCRNDHVTARFSQNAQNSKKRRLGPGGDAKVVVWQ